MHNVIIEEPYQFIPPHRGRIWSSFFRTFLLKRFLRSNYGIVSWEFQGLDRLRDSMRAGHGILLCPNHCRPSDPMLMGLVVKETPCHIYAMASWHIFKQSRLEGFIANRIGGFSVYREGLDRQALETSVQIVADAERPLVVFPEGAISRSNDRLLPLMDGVSFVARMAAARRARSASAGKVVIHPLAIRYRLLGDLETSLSPVLSSLERRTFWKTHEYLPLQKRISQLGQALLATREIECLGQPRPGNLSERMAHLIEKVLHPQEIEWLGTPRQGDVIQRVKDLRMAMMPALIQEKLVPEERQRRWRQLTDSYYLQCLSLYPVHYLDDDVRGVVTPERIAETIHRLEEDITDRVTIRPEWHVELRIGEAMEVDPAQRKSRNGDALMTSLRRNLLELLGVQDWWPPQPVINASAPDLQSAISLHSPANAAFLNTN